MSWNATEEGTIVCEGMDKFVFLMCAIPIRKNDQVHVSGYLGKTTRDGVNVNLV